jgi:platelet-activating factor acetylhydrolase IB subunit alpha
VTSGDEAELMIVTCSTDLTIKLWDTQNDYKNVRTLHGHDHSISTVRFTPDGERLVSASRDKTIRVWEVASGYVTCHTYSSSSNLKVLRENIYRSFGMG